MNITVYLGALEGNDPALGDAVRELGTWIGESGNSLILERWHPTPGLIIIMSIPMESGREHGRRNRQGMKDIVFHPLFLFCRLIYSAQLFTPVSWQPHHTRLPAGIHHFQ